MIGDTADSSLCESEESNMVDGPCEWVIHDEANGVCVRRARLACEDIKTASQCDGDNSKIRNDCYFMYGLEVGSNLCIPVEDARCEDVVNGAQCLVASDGPAFQGNPVAGKCRWDSVGGSFTEGVCKTKTCSELLSIDVCGGREEEEDCSDASICDTFQGADGQCFYLMDSGLLSGSCRTAESITQCSIIPDRDHCDSELTLIGVEGGCIFKGNQCVSLDSGAISCEDLSRDVRCNNNEVSYYLHGECFWLYDDDNVGVSNGRCYSKNSTTIHCADVKRKSQCTDSYLKNSTIAKNCSWYNNECVNSCNVENHSDSLPCNPYCQNHTEEDQCGMCMRVWLCVLLIIGIFK
jgi:hypothetical protein